MGSVVCEVSDIRGQWYLWLVVYSVVSGMGVNGMHGQWYVVATALWQGEWYGNP